MNKRHDEASFESTIEATLLANGCHTLDKSTYDLSSHFFPQEALSFIRATQPKEWARLEALNGAQTETQVLKDLTHWLDHHGTLAVLRNGFKCHGRTLRMAFSSPPMA
jgi:type I restriction enzyme R subunit